MASSDRRQNLVLLRACLCDSLRVRRFRSGLLRSADAGFEDDRFGIHWFFV